MGCCDNKKESSIELNTEGLICYCFKHSKLELYEAIKNGTENEILNDIKSRMKDPGCFCEKSNPSGKCCLGDLNSFIKHFKNL